MHDQSIQQNEASLIEQVQKLEEEKNALLDYIEESEASKHESKILNERNSFHGVRICFLCRGPVTEVLLLLALEVLKHTRHVGRNSWGNKVSPRSEPIGP